MPPALRKTIATVAMLASLILSASGAGHAFDLQGHRGARGLAPENTLAAFAMALAMGVTTLETDLAITKDGVLVLSHDPLLNPDIVRGPDGQWIGGSAPAINSLTLAELKRFDVGRLKPDTKYARQFPQQRAIDGQRFPTLAELFMLADTSGKAPRFNIETKLAPDKPEQTPDPETFARLVVDALHQAGVAGRTTSILRWRTLRVVKHRAPEIETCASPARRLARRWLSAIRRPSPWLSPASIRPPTRVGAESRQGGRLGTWSPWFEELAPTSGGSACASASRCAGTVNAPTPWPP